MESSNFFPSDNNKQDMGPQQWIHLLKQASSSNQTFNNQYLVTSKDGRSFQVLSKKEIQDAGEEVRQLSLAEIIDISKRIFDQAQHDYESKAKHMDAHAFLDITKQIALYTEKLINARAEQRDQISSKMTRGVKWTLSAAASLAMVGSFYQNMKKDYEDFQAENTKFRKVINSLRQSTYIKELNNKLAKIPGVIAKAKDLSNEQIIKGFITLQMEKGIQEKGEHPNKPLDIFVQDLERGITFLRKDPLSEIDDKAPLPPREMTDLNQKVKIGVQSIAELTIWEKSSQKAIAWEVPLQTAATQTSLNALFDLLKQHFMIEITSQVWKEKGKNVNLVLHFNELPPIYLEIVRHPETKEIVEIQVAIYGTADIVKTEPGNSDNPPELIASSGILGKLTYSITLAENNFPQINEIAFTFRSNLESF